MSESKTVDIIKLKRQFYECINGIVNDDQFSDFLKKKHGDIDLEMLRNMNENNYHLFDENNDNIRQKSKSPELTSSDKSPSSSSTKSSSSKVKKTGINFFDELDET